MKRRITPEPLAYFLVKQAGGVVGQPPKSVRALWPLLGHTPRLGIRNKAVRLGRWSKVLNKAPGLEHWLRSEEGLRAPPRWSPKVGQAFRDNDCYTAPLVFAAGCFPGRQELAARYTGWRGMPELHAAAHGWKLTPEEEDEAVLAVEALGEHIPFLVYALCPSFLGVAPPNSDGGVIRRTIERSEFLADPLGRTEAEWRHAIDPEVWTGDMIKALDRRPWSLASRYPSVERSLVEGGYRGWKVGGP